MTVIQVASLRFRVPPELNLSEKPTKQNPTQDAAAGPAAAVCKTLVRAGVPLVSRSSSASPPTAAAPSLFLRHEQPPQHSSWRGAAPAAAAGSGTAQHEHAKPAGKTGWRHRSPCIGSLNASCRFADDATANAATANVRSAAADEAPAAAWTDAAAAGNEDG